jgi:hypothetical protein
MFGGVDLEKIIRTFENGDYMGFERLCSYEI